MRLGCHLICEKRIFLILNFTFEVILKILNVAKNRVKIEKKNTCMCVTYIYLSLVFYHIHYVCMFLYYFFSWAMWK